MVTVQQQPEQPPLAQEGNNRYAIQGCHPSFFLPSHRYTSFIYESHECLKQHNTKQHNAAELSLLSLFSLSLSLIIASPVPYLVYFLTYVQMQYSSLVHYPPNASAQQMQQHLSNSGFNGADGQMTGEGY